MRKVLNILARLMTVAAIALMLLADATEGLTAGLWSGMCVLLAVLCGFLDDRMKRQDNQKKLIIDVEATVLSHRTVRERMGRGNYVINYYVCFRTADGQRLEFQVSELDFGDFDVGENGPLRYRGWQFLSFGVKDKSGIEPMAPLPEEYDQPQAEKPSPVRQFAAWLKTKMSKTDQKPEMQAERKPEVGILTHELDE